MVKWLAAAAFAILAVLAVLLLQLRAPATEVTVQASAPRAAAPTAASRAAQLAAIGEQLKAANKQPGKLDPASDAFFYRFDEAVPPALTREAAKCYTGGLDRVHRNAKTKLGYKIMIKDGVVAFSDVTVVESTVSNKTLEDCFVRAVAGVTWRDDELPDWAQTDELVIRPERGMKKFTAENLAYEGDGPIGTLDSPVGRVAASRELPD